MPDAIFIIGGLLGVLAFGWCAVDGLRKGVVRLPMSWLSKDGSEYSREQQPGKFRAVMAANLLGIVAFA